MTYEKLRQHGFAPNECDYILQQTKKEIKKAKNDVIVELTDILTRVDWSITKNIVDIPKFIKSIAEQLKEQKNDYFNTCGKCKEFGTVNCNNTFREPVKTDKACIYFKPYGTNKEQENE